MEDGGRGLVVNGQGEGVVVGTEPDHKASRVRSLALSVTGSVFFGKSTFSLDLSFSN